jgi:hypothetical protein
LVGDLLVLGNIACHVYARSSLTISIRPIQHRWQMLIERHGTLRMIICPMAASKF